MNELLALLKNAKNAVIIPHTNQDCDCIAAAVSMRALLRTFGVSAAIYLEEPLLPHLAFLGEDFIVAEEGSPLPTADTAIAVDCGDEKRLGIRLPLFTTAAHRVNIDHHITNTMYGQINLVRPDASATAEIMFDIFEAAQAPITPEIATQIYAGIVSDTGGFRYSNTTAKTHRTAAALIERGASANNVCEHLFETLSLTQARLQAAVLGNMELYHDNQTAVMVLTEAFLTSLGATEKDTDGLSGLLRTIEGVHTAATLKEVGDTVHLSMRSDGTVNVAAICTALGGGGHDRAAGATLSGSAADRKTQILDAIGAAYDKRLC